jgi:hypothetical protein
LSTSAHCWTARIALLAYLVGGWLLPLAHRHTNHAIATVASGAAVAGAAPHCCHHDAVPAEAEVSQPPAEPPPGVGRLTAAAEHSSHHACGGPCALCVARTLASWKPVGIAPAHSSPLSTDAGPLPEPPPLQTLLFGVRSVRGPPAIRNFAS